MKEQHKKNLFKFFFIMDILVIAGLLCWLVAYGMTLYGLTLDIITELNPVMKRVLFTKDELDFVAINLFRIITGAVGNAVVIRYYTHLILSKQCSKFYTIDWPWIKVKKWYYIWPFILLIVFMSWYFIFSVYHFLLAFIDMFHDLMVFKALATIGVL